ncbi:MAG: SpoIIE family protein phosphatase [Rhodocyclaceae bacterium]|jgi:serine phosphatase RsbU (regulator of sigma subunit)|nr:SpoIIE family protein phosphatase [Rhodocyclaceae bacterium]
MLSRFGLRTKSIAALALACLVALIPAGAIGWLALEGVRTHFGEAYARNFTQLNRERILAPVSRDLALSRRLAGSEVTRQWLLDEGNPERRDLFFREAEGYRQDFRDHSYFLISNLSRHYYFNDAEKPFSAAPRYTLDPMKADDAWFFNTVRDATDYNINVNPDVNLRVTRVWLNVLVYDGERKIGLAGTGLDLSAFVREFIATGEPGVTPLIVDRSGAIQAHPDERRIAYGSAAGARDAVHTLSAQLSEDGDRAAVTAAMVRAETEPGTVQLLPAKFDGRDQLLALSYVPELKWHVVTAVDLRAARVLEGVWAQSATAALVLLLVALLGAFGYAVERLVLQPLRKLHQSALAIAGGHYELSLPPGAQDEIGDLSRAFGTMADQVRRHTTELEERVRQRTAALEQANQEMRVAHKQINDSIDYASLIQRATLPNRQLEKLLDDRHFILWRPRDVVGGDFYLFRAEGMHLVIGVVDCAGHGVPGALMTMLARSAIDHAMAETGVESPSAILAHTDTALRAMLQQHELPRAIATNMDAGIACVDLQARTLRYAGARIALYWSDGETVGVLKGGRRALVDRRVGDYHDAGLPLRPGCTYYLATDGFLDQAGGELGYGMGYESFTALLRANARLPMNEQAEALDRALLEWRGDRPQRDDVTLLSFRFDD